MTDFLIRLLRMILQLVTPELRKLLCDFLREFEVKAKKTPNPVDDLLAEVLKELFAC